MHKKYRKLFKYSEHHTREKNWTCVEKNTCKQTLAWYTRLKYSSEH